MAPQHLIYPHSWNAFTSKKLTELLITLNSHWICRVLLKHTEKQNQTVLSFFCMTIQKWRSSQRISTLTSKWLSLIYSHTRRIISSSVISISPVPKNLASGSDNETVEEVELTGSLVSVSVLAFARFAWLESSAKKKKKRIQTSQ